MFVDVMGKEKVLANKYDATSTILDFFNNAGRFMDNLQYYDPSVLAPNNWHVQDGSPLLLALFSYYTLTDYNIKINSSLINESYLNN